ncbi:MAG: methionyl-tRNA formyltransferase [Anaerolineales bacterium]|nr:methionyl-tRNA formyltransferase [Anaerolineales bacterium]
MSLRVVFFGNQQSVFTSRHFQALRKTNTKLVAVVDAPGHRRSTSNPLPPGYDNFVEIAAAQDAPLFSPDNLGDQSLVAELAGLDPDVFLAVGYPLILKPSLLSVPRRLAVNFHASLLPDYRGRHPVFWALRAGERWSGLTVHVMDPGVDTGDILYQVRLRTRKDDSVASLYDRIMDRSEALVGRLIADLERDELRPQPQPPGDGSCFSSIKEEDYLLDWRWPAEKLRRYVATTPGKCYVGLQGQRIHIINADTIAASEQASPGTILWLGRTRAGVAAGEGAISSSRVRVGRKNLVLAQLCRALELAPGDSLR